MHEIDRVLRPAAGTCSNLIDGPRLAFARAEAATLRTVFEHVAVVTWTGAFDGGGGNVVLVASHEPLDPAASRRGRAGDPEAGVLVGAPELDAFVAGAPVLTDDFAPTDQLLRG